MKRPWSISRRTLLRGAGGVAVALPMLDAMVAPGRARAAVGASKRFVVFFSPNGTIADAWTPTGTETAFELNRIMEPLAPHKDKLVVIAGLNQRGLNGDGHQRGMGAMLTGQVLNPGPFKNGDGGTAGWANGISVDQQIAATVGKSTKFKSLELGVLVSGSDNYSRMCYAGPDQPIPPEDNPYNAFKRLFAGGPADQAQVAKLRARRHTIIDALKDDYSSLSRRLGTADKRRVDAHLASIRDIESRLDAPSAATAACKSPTVGPPIDVKANDNLPAIGRLQMDLLAMALACDLTRVASLQWTKSSGDVRFNWVQFAVPTQKGHHAISHEDTVTGGGDGVYSKERLVVINRWYAEQFAYLIGKLRAIQDGGATLLDNSVLVWCNELATGGKHSTNGAPYVLAGGGGGALRTGRFLKFENNTGHNNLWVSMLNLFDIPATTFGYPTWCTGPLSGLL